MDKMFIRVYNHRNNDGKLEKVEYDYKSSPDKQSREQRENALLDIELGILRNKSVAEALFDPGNFDPIKRESRIRLILYDVADTGDSLLAIWQEEHGIDYTVRGIRNNMDFNYEDVITKVNKILNPSLETVYLPSDDDALSSSMVREFMHHNIDVHEFVPYSINRLIESGMY